MKILGLCLLFFLLGACASIETPSPPPAAELNYLEVVRHFPDRLPKGSSRFDDTQLFFVHADQAATFAASIVVPIPFITDAIVDSANQASAQGYALNYEALSVFEQTLQALANHPRLQQGPGGYALYPLLFIEECYDEVYRLSISFQLESGDWMGRYYYHLPTPLPKGNIGAPTEEELITISQEMQEGARRLLEVIEQDLQGQHQPEEGLYTVGSLFIVGGRLSGITSPLLLKYRHARILEEDESSVIVRIPGNPTGDATSGGLAYGIHHFYRDQLHTLELEEE